MRRISALLAAVGPTGRLARSAGAVTDPDSTGRLKALTHGLVMAGVVLAVIGLSAPPALAAKPELSPGCDALNDPAYDGLYRSPHADRVSELYMFFAEGERVVIGADSPPEVAGAEIRVYATEEPNMRAPFPGEVYHTLPYGGGYGFAWDVVDAGGTSLAVTWDVRCLRPAAGKAPVPTHSSPPVGPPLSPPVGPPLSPPVGPPLSPPVGPPLSPPVGPPLSPPVGPPLSPPVSPPMNAAGRPSGGTVAAAAVALLTAGGLAIGTKLGAVGKPGLGSLTNRK